jgi:hypothetical protein
MPPSPDFRVIKKTDIPQASRGRWRTRPIVRLAGGQLFFSRHANVFGAASLALVEFAESGRALKFTAVDNVPGGLTEDDLFHLTRQGRHATGNGCSVAAKSLLAYIGFHRNGTTSQELEIGAIDREKRSICVILPLASLEASDVEAGDVDSSVEVHKDSSVEARIPV